MLLKFGWSTKRGFQKVASVYIEASQIQTTGSKGLKGFQIIISNYSCWSMMFTPKIFLTLYYRGLQFLIIRQEWGGVRDIAGGTGGYIKP